MKLEPSAKKGIFVGYNENLKSLQGVHSSIEEDSGMEGCEIRGG